VLRSGRVMRNAAVFVHRDDRFVPGRRQPFPDKSLHNPLLDVILRRAANAYAPSYLLKRFGGDRVNLVARSKVRADLLITHRGLEIRDQVAGADDLVTETPNHLQASTKPT